MINFCKLILFVASGLVAYAYLLYPALVWLLARAFGRTTPRPVPSDEALPSVTLLIAAHNEEAVIAERVENALRLDYPAGRLRVVVASDGSADATASIVAGYADRGVRVLDFPVRRGKASVLNDAMASIDAELVLLSDANTTFQPDVARKLAAWFVDPQVGCVCGRLVLIDPSTGGNADGLYWRYETLIKKCEARLGGLLGSNGAIYAIRRSVFRPIPANTIVDDFVIPLLAKARTGCEILYDADAIATEETAPDVAGEFHRRARIGAGGFQAIGILLGLLNPLRGWVAFTFLSHKVLRWLCPFFLILMLAANLCLIRQPAYAAVFLAQCAGYAIAWLGTHMPSRPAFLKVLRLPAMFVAMNAALLVGFARWVSGRQRAAWRRTPRPADETDALASRTPVARSGAEGAPRGSTSPDRSTRSARPRHLGKDDD